MQNFIETVSKIITRPDLDRQQTKANKNVPKMYIVQLYNLLSLKYVKIQIKKSTEHYFMVVFLYADIPRNNKEIHFFESVLYI